jgi:hypothetical protein
MSKLEETLRKYAKEAQIILEQEPLPPVDPMAAAAPAPAPVPGVDPNAPAVPAGEQPPAEEEGKTKKLTDQGYVMAVQDMLELLSINPEDLEENDMDIFEDRVNPKNAYDLHDKLRELIDRYGSPTA